MFRYSMLTLLALLVAVLVLRFLFAVAEKKWLVRVSLAALLLIAFSYGASVYYSISTSLHAEMTLHAINLVTVVVDRFVQQENRWPKSWDDLQVVRAVDVPSCYSWPDDAETLRDFVAIDFDADLTTLGSQTVEEFDAIGPTGAYYPYKDYGFIQALIENAKTVVVGQQETNRDPDD